MKKVLFLIHTLGVGGAEKVLVNLVNHMDHSKYDITVMTVINTGAFRKELNANIHYKTMFRLPRFLEKKEQGNRKSGSLLNKTSKSTSVLAKLYTLFWKLAPCKLIYKKFIKEKYDYEIAFLEGITAKIIAESTNENSHKISWIHVDLLNERKSEKFFINRNKEKKVYEKFEKIVAVSQYVKEQFIKKFGIDENKVLVRYNPIDENYIYTASEEKVEDIEKKKFTLCTVGRLAPQKGYDRLVKVAKRLNEKQIDYELWIIGVGPDEEKLKNYIEENQLRNVKLLGYKQNPYKYMRMSDLFVCSSRAEGFSTVVSEAIILGKPIVTTECSGMRELLGEHGEYGRICANKEEDLYKSLLEVLLNKEIYEYYKEKILERKGLFHIENSVENIQSLLGD